MTDQDYAWIPKDEPPKDELPKDEKVTEFVEPVRKGRRSKKKTNYEDGQAPISVCNKQTEQTLKGIRLQRHEDLIRWAKSIVESEE